MQQSMFSCTPEWDLLFFYPYEKILSHIPVSTRGKDKIRTATSDAIIVADRKHASTCLPVAFRSVHTGIEPPFFLKKIYYAITACMTQGFTFRKY